MLPLSAFSSIAGWVRELYPGLGKEPGGRRFEEFTVEVNPEDIAVKGRAFVEGLLSVGVDRVSMGVQSFDDALLKWMNRRHDSATALKAYGILQDAGVKNISIDLIFGISHLDDTLWQKTVEKAVSLHPQHISAYQLSVEPGSALAGMVKSGKYAEAPESQCRRQYDMLCGILSEAGYHHYEISNFALPGHEARHNSAYWRHVPYAGFGPGAHSFRRISGSSESARLCSEAGTGYIRSWNAQDIRKYISFYTKARERSEAGFEVAHDAVPAGVSDYEMLTEDQLAIERIMLGLRTDAGVETAFLKEHCDKERLETLIDKGMLVPSAIGGNMRIPENCFFISDSIISDII